MKASFGPYVVEEAVANGSTGTVYRARHQDLGRLAAIKDFSPAVRDVPGQADRLRSEATLLAAMSHPNIVEVYDYVEEADGAWIAEQWVDGATLEQILDGHGTLSPEQALGVVRGAVLGLAYAHDLDIVHRDISTANIMADNAGTSMLVDFGIAAPSGAGTVAGTPAFLSPEAAAGQPLTKQSDVYSIAAVLFLLLTGRPVFGGSVAETVKAHLQGDPPPLDGHGADLAALLERSLSKSPEDRPEDAGAFLVLLEHGAAMHYGRNWLAGSSIAGLAGLFGRQAASTAVGGGGGGVAAGAATTAASAISVGTLATVAAAAAVLLGVVAGGFVLLRGGDSTSPPPGGNPGPAQAAPPGAGDPGNLNPDPGEPDNSPDLASPVSIGTARSEPTEEEEDEEQEEERERTRVADPVDATAPVTDPSPSPSPSSPPPPAPLTDAEVQAQNLAHIIGPWEIVMTVISSTLSPGSVGTVSTYTLTFTPAEGGSAECTDDPGMFCQAYVENPPQDSFDLSWFEQVFEMRSSISLTGACFSGEVGGAVQYQVLTPDAPSADPRLIGSNYSGQIQYEGGSFCPGDTNVTSVTEVRQVTLRHLGAAPVALAVAVGVAAMELDPASEASPVLAEGTHESARLAEADEDESRDSDHPGDPSRSAPDPDPSSEPEPTSTEIAATESIDEQTLESTDETAEPAAESEVQESEAEPEQEPEPAPEPHPELSPQSVDN